MDETGFAQKQKSRKVIAFKGSGNVWTKSADANFHMTYVVAVSATGVVAPPLMIIPGQRLNRDLLDGCDIPGARVTCAPKGFMNSALFLRWLEHFATSVPDSVKRPLVLVYDGYSSHYNDDIVSRAVDLKIILVLLPANSTHLLQTLDISVFKTFKACLKACITNYMIANGKTTLTKKDALTIFTLAWKEGIVETAGNILAGFKAGGMYLLSFPAMQTKFRLFQDQGIEAFVKSPSGCRQGR
jgi:hypothetical protein